jgi:hypothetical protein
MNERQTSSRSANGTIGRVTTYALANGTKVMGIYLGIKEAGRENVRESVLIFAACLALGAQTVENIVLKAIDRFFGGGNG